MSYRASHSPSSGRLLGLYEATGMVGVALPVAVSSPCSSAKEYGYLMKHRSSLRPIASCSRAPLASARSLSRFFGLAAGAVGTIGCVVGAVLMSRMLVRPRSATLSLRILGVRASPPQVELETPRPRLRGSVALEIAGGRLLAPRTAPGRQLQLQRTMTWPLDEQEVAEVCAGSRVAFTPAIHQAPCDVDLVAEEVLITSPAGECPAWFVPGNDTWAIHVHGFRATRSSTLRSLATSLELRAMTSMLISVRNDGDGPATPSGMGYTESADLDAALRFARDHGARRIMLVGWSMGAVPCLLLHDSDEWRPLITGMILESPILDWPATLRAHCRRYGIPSLAGVLPAALLSTPGLAQLVGAEEPIPVRALRWTARNGPKINKPCLILQGSNDDSTPATVARRVASLNPHTVALAAFDAGHAEAWNVEPTNWSRAVDRWIRRTRT